MSYTRNWIKSQIKSYVHDSSSTFEAALDTFIDLGASRVSQVLQCWEMEKELTRLTGATENYIDLGATTRLVLGVQWKHFGGQYVNLRSVPRHNADYYKHDGQPCVYLIEGRRIYPLPYMDSDYKAQVIQDVQIPASGQEIPVLTAYPFIFLNAAIAEAYDWKQNTELLVRYESKWRQEAEAVRSQYISERIGDTPSMRAM